MVVSSMVWDETTSADIDFQYICVLPNVTGSKNSYHQLKIAESMTFNFFVLHPLLGKSCSQGGREGHPFYPLFPSRTATAFISSIDQVSFAMKNIRNVVTPRMVSRDNHVSSTSTGSRGRAVT